MTEKRPREQEARSPQAAPPDTVARDVREAVEAAVWAPSVLNTQPWRFGLRGPRITLRADPDRRLEVADPDGREMLISCGAALYTLRLAIKTMDHEPRVELLPDPDRPHLLADVHLGARTDGDEDARRLYRVVRHRRTHRGAFVPDGIGSSLPAALKAEAEYEGVRLVQAVEGHTRQALAGLTQAAEHLQRLDPAYAGEAARWAPAPGSHRADGVHEGAYPAHAPRTEPHFPGRDFARGRRWGTDDVPENDTANLSAGLVVLITTAGDQPLDWLHAGQGLQRVLLRAALEEDLAAAFHTQALEVPELREFIRTRFCNGRHPQVLLRLGVPAGPVPTTVRRPLDEVMTGEQGGL